MKYNTKIQSIPSNIIAGMFSFKPREYFKAEEGATEVPPVRVLAASLTAPLSIPMYEQIAANKRKTFFLIVRLRAGRCSSCSASSTLLLGGGVDRSS